MRTSINVALFLALLVGVLMLNTRHGWSTIPRVEAGAQTAAVQRSQIPSPPNWVAFSANWKRVGKAGTIVGRYYRASDGSTRLESEDGSNIVISISNVATVRQYAFLLNKWVSYPMRLPPGGYRPSPRILGGTHGLEVSTDVIEGYPVYKMTTIGGVVRYQAPALNFFALVTEFADARQEFFDIVLDEPASELFLPPPNVSIEMRDELKGIVSNDR
jgi:hypothetical protein